MKLQEAVGADEKAVKVTNGDSRDDVVAYAEMTEVEGAKIAEGMPQPSIGTGNAKVKSPLQFKPRGELFKDMFPFIRLSLPHMIQGAAVFLAFVIIGFFVTRSLSLDEIRHFHPYFTPRPYLEFFGIEMNSPYWIEVLELEFCHQFEVVSAIWSGYFLSLFGYFFLAGEGFELSFMNIMRDRTGGFSWAGFAARFPQYMLGYSTIILSAAIGFYVMISGFRGRRIHPKRLIFPTLFCVVLMFANDCLEVFYF